MHYGIGVPGGKVVHVECDPLELPDKLQEMGGVMVTQAETLELYERRRAQDETGRGEIW